jgi:hypothetical protein
MVDDQLFSLHRGDEVAVLSSQVAATQQVRELAIVTYVGPALIQLDNGDLYFVSDGQGMTDCTWIVLATHEHRAALYHHLQEV